MFSFPLSHHFKFPLYITILWFELYFLYIFQLCLFLYNNFIIFRCTSIHSNLHFIGILSALYEIISYICILFLYMLLFPLLKFQLLELISLIDILLIYTLTYLYYFALAPTSFKCMGSVLLNTCACMFLFFVCHTRGPYLSFRFFHFIL